jgi:hypothetical protein
MKTTNRLNWLVALVGLWELLSPFILGYSALTVALWNAVIIGAVLIVLGAGAALYKEVKIDQTLDWINSLLGLWLIVSPFILGYSDAVTAMWNNIIVGLVVLVLAGWAAFTFRKEMSLQA